MPAQISFSTASFSRLSVFHHPLDHAFAFAKNVGFDGVELAENIIVRLLGPTRIARIADEAGIKVLSLHQSLSRMVWTTMAGVEHIVRRSAALGAKCAVVHIASVYRPFQDNNFFTKVHALEKKFGVKVAFENSMAQFQFVKPERLAGNHEPDEFAKIAEQHNLWLTYDVGHMAYCTTDLIGFAERIRPHLLNIHLHDYYRGVDHMALGSGSLPLKEFLHYLASTNFEGLITLEVFPYNTRLWLTTRQVEDIVKRSLEFVREAMK